MPAAIRVRRSYRTNTMCDFTSIAVPLRRVPGLLLTLALLGGCALVPSERIGEANGQSAVPSVASRAGGDAAGNAEAGRTGEPRYIRYRADETGLLSAIDDGVNTYLEFGASPEPSLAINDQDGRPLVWTMVDKVVAVAGLHQGVLLRSGERASFVSPNPRWQGRMPMTLPARPGYAEARARLENQAQIQTAMARALVASAAPAAVKAAAPAPSSGAAPSPALMVGNVGALGGAQALPVAPMRVLQPGVSLSPATMLAPLTTANLTAAAAEQGLIRVFFASASRSIVAPDDGLATLMREAPAADEILITGFTDAIGPIEVNQRLARSRADAVAQILLRRGIQANRIVINAVASDEFIADNATDRGRALNRRAEVVLIRGGRPMMLGEARR